MRIALFIFPLLMLPSARATSPVEKPPAPPIDLGDWNKPSKPIWMETELQEQAGKVRPINYTDCVGDLIASAMTLQQCPASVALIYDVTNDGQATNIRMLESDPAGALDVAATTAVQCFRFTPAEGDADSASRTGVIFRFSSDRCTAP